MSDIGDTFFDVYQWAKARKLDSADPRVQLCKLMEEAGELAEGLLKGRREQVKDSIGDCMVVLTILAIQVDESAYDCFEYAFNQIENRKGKMINGTFVKEEDLPA